MTVEDDGSVRFQLAAGHSVADVDDTLEPGGACWARLRLAEAAPSCSSSTSWGDRRDRSRSGQAHALGLSERPGGPLYLGSKRHLMERIFNDQNEPFWRSAKRIELGPSRPTSSSRSPRRVPRQRPRHRGQVVDRVLAITGGHPRHSSMCYFLWAQTPEVRLPTTRAGERARQAPGLRAHAFQRPLGPRDGQPADPLVGARRGPVARSERLSDAPRSARLLDHTEGGQRARSAGARHQARRVRRDLKPFLADWIRAETR